MNHLEEPILDHLNRVWGNLRWKCLVPPDPDAHYSVRYVFESRCGLILDIDGSRVYDSTGVESWGWEVQAGWKKEYLSQARGRDWFKVLDQALCRSMNVLEERIKKQMACYENLVRSSA